MVVKDQVVRVAISSYWECCLELGLLFFYPSLPRGSEKNRLVGGAKNAVKRRTTVAC